MTTPPTTGEREHSRVEVAGLLVAGSAGLVLGLRDQSPGWLVHHGLGVVVTGPATWWLLLHLGDRSPLAEQVESIVAPLVGALALGLFLPWSPGVTGVCSAVVCWEYARFLHRRLRPHPPGRRHRVDQVLSTVTLAVLLAVGAVAIPLLLDDETPTGIPVDFRCYAAVDLGLPADVAAAIEQALAREGGEVGCLTSHHFNSERGVHGVVTSADYVVLGWPGPEVAGSDGEPHAAVWWENALLTSNVLSLLDDLLPSDRLQCRTGAVAFLLDDAGRVRGVVGAADHVAWFLVPEPLVGAYVQQAYADGRLPMPTGPAANGEGGWTMPVNGGVVLSSAVPAAAVTAEQLAVLCERM